MFHLEWISLSKDQFLLLIFLLNMVPKISCSFKPIYVVEDVFCNHQIAFFFNLSILISVGDAPKYPKWQRFPYLAKNKSCVKPCHLLSSSPFPLPSLPFFFSYFPIPILPSFLSSSISPFLFYLPICFLSFPPISPACLLSLSSLSFILLASAFFFPPLSFLFFLLLSPPPPPPLLLISPLC